MKHEKIQIVPPNEIFDEYFLGQGVPTTRSVTEVTFTAPKFLFEIQAVAGVKD